MQARGPPKCTPCCYVFWLCDDLRYYIIKPCTNFLRNLIARPFLICMIGQLANVITIWAYQNTTEERAQEKKLTQIHHVKTMGTGRCSDNRCSDKVESTVGSVHDFWAGRLSAKGLNRNGSCWNYCSGNVRKRNDTTISAV